MSVLSFRCKHGYPAGFHLDVEFDIAQPFTALFGPSGSGKTSILNMIAGFLRPQQGMIRLGDRILLDTVQGVSLPPEKRHVGVVFQDSLLFPHLSVEGNLRYGQRRRDRRGRMLDFSRVVDVLEIGPLLQRFPRNLSGGERQRVALGRALLSGPEMLLMDEPLASLDAPLRDRVLSYLERAVTEWSIPTLFVTHAQAEVRRRPSGWSCWIKGGWLALARRRTPSVNRNRWPGPIRPAPSICSGWTMLNLRTAFVRPESVTKSCNCHLTAAMRLCHRSCNSRRLMSLSPGRRLPESVCGTACGEQSVGSSPPIRPYL